MNDLKQLFDDIKADNNPAPKKDIKEIIHSILEKDKEALTILKQYEMKDRVHYGCLHIDTIIITAFIVLVIVSLF